MTIRALLAIIASLLVVTSGADAADIRQGRGDCIKLAVPFDVSGSMRPYLEAAKQGLIELLRTLRPCDVFVVIPFAETRLESFRRELTPETRDRDLADAEAFIRRLRTGGRKGDSFGHFTNVDEGIDAAMLALYKENAVARGVVVLISDGLSDPDPQHRPVDLSKLGERLPKDGFNLYLVDLSGTGIAGGEDRRIGEFPAAVPPSTAMVVIPIKDTARLGEFLRQLEQHERAAAAPADAAPAVGPPAAEPSPGSELEPPAEPRALSPLWWLAVPMALVPLIIWLRRRRPRAEPGGRRRLLQVNVNDREQRYALPVKLTIGSGERGAGFGLGARRAPARAPAPRGRAR